MNETIAAAILTAALVQKTDSYDSKPWNYSNLCQAHENVLSHLLQANKDAGRSK